MPTPKNTSQSTSDDKQTVGGILGVGLDDDDGHRRVTKGDDFYLVGGSEKTHERLQDLVIRMSDTLKRQGRRFKDLNGTEIAELARDSLRS